ncbi:helix-turn-helix transcriptional regulator [Streptomyces hirsutus]
MVLRREPTARHMRLGVRAAQAPRSGRAHHRRGGGVAWSESGCRSARSNPGSWECSEQRLRRLASHYACTDAEFIDALVDMATDRTHGWWEEYRGLLPTSFLDLSELNRHASFRRDVAILYVPGLLQTEGYARAVFSGRVPELAEEELEVRVRHRMAGQEIAVPYDLVIHESALRIRVGDRAASRAQLTKLLGLSEADNITMRVIPFDLDGFAKAGSTMTYVGGPAPKLDTVVRDVPHGSAFIDSEAQLGAFRTRFRKLEAVALDPQRSRDFINRLVKEL